MPNESSNPLLRILNQKHYQRGWNARMIEESWWHLNWLEASWLAGWLAAGQELAANPELAKKVLASNKRRRTIERRKKGSK